MADSKSWSGPINQPRIVTILPPPDFLQRAMAFSRRMISCQTETELFALREEILRKQATEGALSSDDEQAFWFVCLAQEEIAAIFGRQEAKNYRSTCDGISRHFIQRQRDGSWACDCGRVWTSLATERQPNA